MLQVSKALRILDVEATDAFECLFILLDTLEGLA